MKRFSVFLKVFGRRSVPKNWNERNQNKRGDWGESSGGYTIVRRIKNRRARAMARQHLANFRGDWEDYIRFIYKDWLD